MNSPVSALVLATGLALAGESAAQQIVLDGAAVEACLSEDDRIDRLGCYDLLLGRPSDPPALLPPPEPIAAEGVSEIPAETRAFQRLFQTPTVTDEGVAVTVLANDTGQAVLRDPDRFLQQIMSGQSGDQSEAFRRDHDVFLAIPTLPDQGEEGMLVVSCENNITHLRAIWPTPFDRSAIASRFLFGNALADPSRQRDMVLRARPGGFELIGPRGLESIRMLGEAVSGQRLQIATGTGSGAGPDAVRSLFFDMEPLRAALPLVARHCSWSVQTFRREF